MQQNYSFTSESVTAGHPDKLCDRISDAILDAYLTVDPDARVACETTATTGRVNVMGEITSSARMDLQEVVRRTIWETGYQDDRFGLDAQNCKVEIALDQQSEDIDAGVSRTSADAYEAVGAGDQGMMFGYACTDTPCLMPAPIYYAHLLCRRLDQVRREGILDYLGPDGKSMVTVVYEHGQPAYFSDVVLSCQHRAEIGQEELRRDVVQQVVEAVLPKQYCRAQTRVLINPTGRFVKGGPEADSGLTGRKIIVDTYGGMGRHGGGAFSGKDATKVDRTGAYAARQVAKELVASGLAQRCEVQISYAIGVAHPVSVFVDTFGTGKVPEEDLCERVKALFDLRPGYLIEKFGLKRPIYTPLSAYGHFGREDLSLPWEQTGSIGGLNP